MIREADCLDSSGCLDCVRAWLLRVATAASVIAPIAAQDIGYEGPGFTGAGATPTEAKPESKLWFNDGFWWGSLWSTSASAYRIHRINFFSHTWVDTGVAIDSRPNSHGDALWDGTKLYIASHQFSTTGSSSGNPIRLYRYSYNGAADTYSLDTGFPVTIGDYSTEALTIEKDSTGTLWAAWTQSRRVRIAHSQGSDTSWSSSFILPTNTSNIDVDDICSLIRFRGNRIGVLWSDQVANGYRFSFHEDGAGDTSWSARESVTTGAADDHLNLAADSTGRVFLAGKDVLNNLLLLVRGANGGWTQRVIADPTPVLTRPIVLLNEEARTIHVFATGQDTGEVFEKTSNLDDISFAPSTGTIRMRDASTVFRISDPTSTKQNITRESGLVVLAHHDTTRFYWHHEVVPPPTTNFSGSPTTGIAPLTVNFTDVTIGPAATRVWNFGDGSTSSATNPSHVYAAGTYTVSLTATGPGGSDTETKTNLVVVAHPPPVANFNTAPTNGFAPLNVTFTDASSGGPVTSRLWSFGDGGTSSAANPSHVYAAGTYTVSLTATGPGGTDTETKANLIVVVHPPPAANFSASPTSGFAPLSVTFTDSSTGPISSRQWSFGDGSTSSATNPSRVYAAGTYTVSLTATGPGGTDTETKTNYIVVAHPPPAANFSASPTSGSAPLTVAFSDESTGPITSRLWTFGDGSTSSATSPSHTYAAGTYTVRLTATGPGGSDSETKTDFIVVGSSPPVANFGATPTSGASPLTVNFTDASTGPITSRLWSFGDGGTSSATNPSHVYAAGTYTVSLTATGPGGSDTETKTNLITVTPPSQTPVANFNASPTGGAPPLTVNFTDASTGSITSRLWNFGDGGTSSATNPSHVFAAGTYTVSLTVTGPGGSDVETKTNWIQAGLMAKVETAPVPSAADAADDVAVWIHPTNRALSTVIGTDKTRGVGVYDLAGNTLQFLADGQLNNVDLRYGFPLGGTEVALVTCGERGTNRIAIYAVDPGTRLLRNVAARVITPGIAVKGSCMYRSHVTGDTYFFGTSETGQMEQWRLFDDGAGRVDAVRVRTFSLPTQVEGCVADDEAGFFFCSEEAAGVWRFGAEPGAGTARVLVDSTGAAGHLTEDVEGLTIYYASGGAGYLLVSSQGSSDYAVYDRRAPHAFLFQFQIGENLALGIDAVTGTDGIEVVNLGLGSAFPGGVFIVQDDVNPGANQNFKLVPWPAIANSANPPLLVDTSYDPHDAACVAASSQPRNGSGLNAFTLTNRQEARLGTTWECDLDCGGHAPGNGVIWVYARPATGPVIAWGEWLVDRSSPLVFSLSASHTGNTLRFAAPVPANTALCGVSVSVQGLCTGAPLARLSNAIDLVLGM